MNEEHLRRAIALAAEARAGGNPPFGSLLVGPDGTVLAEERNSSITDNDITAHPELKLARWAARELDAATAAGTTMYTSCEPCGMCAGALARSGIGHVVFALPMTSSRFRPVPTEGPYLYEEAKVPVEGYYAQK
ncbi:nucleoside deaminase [Goodfellowiella coeruleoviolacea]|uniref:tRNA(Arg) A34 adenosine deaminase TadA n=1 Tax=Goodfellowiella coeruleoviolacea TaxID=334858 RepID=A0AAE3KI04_9PSEU|nr:nucleoside deaminase [Goodfellowiella coeruleoviolacea]MCP2168771.1 tRNA(Arg) A34 adenosine deaminase TadA [Goodfellowiella coeruleoviolacea]